MAEEEIIEKLPAWLKRQFDKVKKELEYAASERKEKKEIVKGQWLDYVNKNPVPVKTYNLAKRVLQEQGQLGISENQAYLAVSQKVEEFETQQRLADEEYQNKVKELNKQADQIIAEGKRYLIKKALEHREVEDQEQDIVETEKPEEQPQVEQVEQEEELDESIAEANKTVIGEGTTTEEEEGLQARKDALRWEIIQLDRQVFALRRKLVELRRKLQVDQVDEYTKAVIEREIEKVKIDLGITNSRLQSRHKIQSGARLDYSGESESEYSDGGYSQVESDEEYHHTFQVRDHKVKKRLRRVPKVEKKKNTMAEMKWSMKDIPKFHGDRRQGETASSHLMEFSDFLRNIGIQEGTEHFTDARVKNAIGYFMQSLKGRSRQWFDLTFADTERETRAHWERMKKEFLQEYNPVGSTREQQIKAWKDMKWDPATESLTDFVYRYKELGNYLGYDDPQLLQSFLCCVPGSMYIYVMNAKSLTEAITNLKKCLALGTGITVEPKKEPEKPVVPFMMAAERSVSFPSDVVLTDKIKTNVEKVVEEQVGALTQTMEGKLETLTVALDKFQSNQRGRSQSRDRQSRDNDRGRSPYRARSPSGGNNFQGNGRPNRFGRNGKPICNYCQREGHIERLCWEKHGYPPGRGRQGGPGGGRFGNPNNYNGQGQGRFGNQNGYGGQGRFGNQGQGQFGGGGRKDYDKNKTFPKKEVANVVKDVIKQLKKNGVEMKSTN